MVEERVDERAGEQLVLVPALARARAEAASATARTRAKAARPEPEPAATLPVARVLVDVPLAHLNRPFDYLVTAAQDEEVRLGCRVKVRFAGQDVDGFVLDRVETSAHPGRLAPLRRVVSSEPVLTPEVAALCEAVAARYAGTCGDVLRLAVPPRHATAERRASAPAPEEPVDAGAAAAWWGRYDGGAHLVSGLTCRLGPDAQPGNPSGPLEHRPARVVWTAAPGEDWARGLALAAKATLAGGRGAVLCVPDHRDLAVLDSALEDLLGPGRHVCLSANSGPAARYRAFLAVSRGSVRVVAGTRAAAFAPVRDLGLVAIWDDGDDLYAEPRAPYPHAREVLLLRAHQSRCSAIVAGTACSVEAATLLRSGWAEPVAAPRVLVRERAPLVSVTGATDRELERDPTARTARLPRSAHEVIRAALETGPVLVQSPRRGYAEALVCASCREPARCGRCTGPLRLPAAGQAPVCRWCGAADGDRHCPSCGDGRLRAPVLGDRRTVEELGRAFPGVPVRRSSGDHVLDDVDAAPAIIVATPGAEPPATGGYAAAILLDTWLTLARPDLRATEEAVRRWFNAATLARPASQSGRVVLVGDPAHPALQALVRWDPRGFAEREADERRTAHLPPASRLAVLTGAEDDVTAAVARLVLPPGAEVLGPSAATEERARTLAEDEPHARMVVRVPKRAGPALSRALAELQAVRSAKKLPPIRVQVDPLKFG